MRWICLEYRLYINNYVYFVLNENPPIIPILSFDMTTTRPYLFTPKKPHSFVFVHKCPFAFSHTIFLGFSLCVVAYWFLEFFLFSLSFFLSPSHKHHLYIHQHRRRRRQEVYRSENFGYILFSLLAFFFLKKIPFPLNENRRSKSNEEFNEGKRTRNEKKHT